MKTTKITTLKSLSMLFLSMLLFSACGQSRKNSELKGSVVAPKVDIHTAVISGDLEAVHQHIEAGSDINVKEPFNGSTPLITAATFGKKEIAQALIDAGADLSIKNNDGTTPLHSAAFFCRVEIVQQLIDAKANKNLLNKYGSTPRQTVMGPFEDVKPIYEMLQQQLAPMGFQLDMAEVEKSRPVVAMMLQ
ncbi:ankyrin repeat domain-containing protein [Lentiprolixibacter aurantiacus]|uniref:Ankyrin repeat domain-containing protein n=1 Tax=Lentiprolixibacter aurantiacus TaxID=2993939 RepID=A0AAE3MJA8_9FLAO|nr:ankyrin repeat domain-containing protein [Lentiprolixibacter aurantiacus]MCX2718474.1 ankyrin repeat domain-containing protein [Lentiprolixibacter aurantiacus]